MPEQLQLDQILDFALPVHLERVDDSLALLFMYDDHFLLRGSAAITACSAVDGRRSVAQILQSKGGESCPIKMFEILDRLVEAGICRVASSSAGSAHPIEPTPSGFPSPALRHFIRAFARARENSAAFEFELELWDDYTDPHARRQAIKRRGQSQAWLAVCPVRDRVLVGPYFDGGAGPCWRCLEHWVTLNRPAHTWSHRLRPDRPYPRSPTRATEPDPQTRAAQLASFLAPLQFDTAGREALRREIWELEPSTLERVASHSVVQRPQCPECGDARTMLRSTSQPLELGEGHFDFRDDGGYRVLEPDDTYARLKHLVSPLTGAVTRLDTISDPSSSSRHVVESRHRLTPWDTSWPIKFERLCAGKGRTRAQARTSALCEALERFCSVYQGDESRSEATLADLGDRAIGPGPLQLFSEAQHRRAETAALPYEPRQWIARALPRDLPIRWTSAFSLNERRHIYLPFTYCYANPPPWIDLEYCRHNANGSAAGNCPTEAVLQGMFELIERDAVGIWWYNRIPRPKVDFDAFDDAFFHHTKAEYAERGWELWVLDLTHDLDTPVCAAIAHNPGLGGYSMGFGCHIEAKLAVQRALTELNQLDPRPGQTSTMAFALQKLESSAFLHPDAGLESALDTRARAGYASLNSPLQATNRKLAAHQLETYIVNKSRPDIDLSVVQVVIPGLRHFWPRLAPGRLYEVPMQLGWVDQRLDESELNPVGLYP